MEKYILKRIELLEQTIASVPIDSKQFQYYVGQRDILYQVLTAWDNPNSIYNQ